MIGNHISWFYQLDIIVDKIAIYIPTWNKK